MASGHMTRLALVGYGRIAPKHVEVFRALGAEFVACACRGEESRARAEREGGIPKTYASINQMLQSERPQGVVCLASFDQMYGAAKEIIPFGIPTLLEKPPALSLDELVELEGIALLHSAQVMVGFNRRHYSVLQQALAEIGGVEGVTAAMVDWSEDPQYLLNKRGVPREQMARYVMANSLHGLDLLAMLTGDISRPAIITRDLSREGGEPFRWLMTLSGISERGALATFTSTWDSPGGWRLVVCAPGRRYVFQPLESCQVLTHGEQPRTIQPAEEDQQFKPGFYGQARLFLDVIAGRGTAWPKLADCRAGMKLAVALEDTLLGRNPALAELRAN